MLKPTYILVGIVILSALISILYINWSISRGYSLYPMREGSVITVAHLVLSFSSPLDPAISSPHLISVSLLKSPDEATGGMDGESTSISLPIVLVRSPEYKNPIELDIYSRSLIHAHFLSSREPHATEVSASAPTETVIPLDVPLEPGYNAYRAMEKQVTWYRSASWVWRSSPFHALLIPFELFARWLFISNWIILDFFDHVGKIYAALVVPPSLSPLLPLIMSLKSRRLPISFIESFEGLYLRIGGREKDESP
jgi:hypothetical protein